jgi:hypothetical protein
MEFMMIKSFFNSIKKLGFAIVVLFYGAITKAQNYVDLIKVDYAITPTNAFDSSTISTTLQEINGDFTLPIVINDNTTLLSGAIYENIVASFSPNRPNESLTGITLKLGANLRHNKRLSGTYMLLPKISSDMKNIAERDIQVGGVILMKYTKTEQLNFRFGLYSNRELFGPFIVPIVGFYFLNDSKKLEVKATLPLSFNAEYAIRSNIKTGLNFKGQVRSYNINSHIRNEDHRYLVKSTNDIYTFLRYETKSGLNFQMNFGRSIGRSYRMFSEQVALGMPLTYFDDQRIQINQDFSDSWLFKLGVFYRLNLDES